GGILTTFFITGACLLPSSARRAAKVLVPLLLVFFVILGGGLFARYLGDNSGFGTSLSDLGRILTYTVGFNIIADKPMWGIGFANIVTVYESYGFEQLLLLGRPMGIHNAILEIFAEEGVFGVILYL